MALQKVSFFVLTLAVLAKGQISPTPTPSPDFDCPDMNDSIHPDPNDCSKYFVCTNGLAWHERCADGLLFNPQTLECDWPDNVNCNGTTGTTTRSTTTTTEGPSTTTTNGSSTTWQPTTDDNTMSTDSSQTTTIGTTTTTGIPPTTTPSHEFQCPQPNGVYPHPTDCGSYYVCENNRPILENCPPGLWFDPILLVCNWPEFVDCDPGKK